MNIEELNKEQEQLDLIIKEIEQILDEEKMRLKVLLNRNHQDDEVFWNLVKQNEIHIENLKYSSSNPYFARIVFVDSETNNEYNLYIGKNGINKDSDIIVTDWRAPISSLYYDSDLGDCSYKAPQGEVYGQLKLKRQYEIENKEVTNYFDVDLVASDDLLQKYLNSNNEARLKSIVATIQKEQNEAIRKGINENIIVQGVAGSGKTTVALHRIAYLVYNYIKKIRQDQYMVIGPNPVFLKYIKTVLPELDVSGVEQSTYEKFAADYIGSELTVVSSEEKAAKSIENLGTYEIEKIKSSIKFKNMLDNFFEVYIYGITNNDLMLGDFKILDKEIIRRVFDSTKSEYRKQSVKERVDLAVERLCDIIEEKKIDISKGYTLYTSRLFETAKTDKEKEKLRKKFAAERQDIDKNCRATIRKYFSKIKYDPVKLYNSFISSISDFNIYNYDKKTMDIIKKETTSKLKKKICDFEDLPSLIYLKACLNPEKTYANIRHTVIDEAQDLGEFNFVALKCALPKTTFSIFGDIAQSIYDYRSIGDWNIVNEIMFQNEAQIVNFKKSYRTTAEIMGLADDVADSIGLNRSDMVVRHGAPVSVSNIDSSDEIVDHIISKIVSFKEKGYNSIAIISKTEKESQRLNDELRSKGVDIPNIKLTDDLLDEKFKTCTISNQLAKGLEFDAVIVNNANEATYSSKSKLDMKLLYVATTRALHELEILYNGELTKPIAEYTKKSLIVK